MENINLKPAITKVIRYTWLDVLPRIPALVASPHNVINAQLHGAKFTERLLEPQVVPIAPRNDRITSGFALVSR